MLEWLGQFRDVALRLKNGRIDVMELLARVREEGRGGGNHAWPRLDNPFDMEVS